MCIFFDVEKKGSCLFVNYFFFVFPGRGGFFCSSFLVLILRDCEIGTANYIPL